MAVKYLDFENGNDANDGTTFANRWKTITSGATAARLSPGDEIRIMASPDETLVGNATWTQNSRAITLAAAVTTTIDNCDSAWTAAANVTATASTANPQKEGTGHANLVVATAFTTGKVAYKATGTLNLSTLQQVSFWFWSSLTHTSGIFRLALCSDTTGDVVVQNIAIPAYPGNSRWQAITVDVGSALPSSVQSVALYADVDPGTPTIGLDNIIACKASSSADSLTLNSLIGRDCNRVWQASTAYSLNDERKPTQTNRNGWRYKVTTAGTTSGSEPSWPAYEGGTVTDGSVVWTCIEPEDTWYAISSIVGTTVNLDLGPSAQSTETYSPYQGATGTFSTYKREPIRFTPTNNFSNTSINVIQEGGSSGNINVWSGGWDRTNMSTLSGETWATGGNGNGNLVFTFPSYTTMKNVSGVRFNQAIKPGTGLGTAHTTRLELCHTNNNTQNGVFADQQELTLKGCCAVGNYQTGFKVGVTMLTAQVCRADGNGAGNSDGIGLSLGSDRSRIRDVWAAGNRIGVGNFTGNAADCIVYNAHTARNTSYAFNPGNTSNAQATNMDMVRCTIAETEWHQAFSTNATPRFTLGSNQAMRYHGCNGDPTDQRRYFFGGYVITDATTRHTASGVSYKFKPGNASVAVATNPLTLSVAKIAVAAGTTIHVQIWTRRDGTNVAGKLFMRGGQIAGVPEDVTVSCSPTINTWVQSSTLVFTPTENGVVDIEFGAWNEANTTESFWVDDLTVTT